MKNVPEKSGVSFSTFGVAGVLLCLASGTAFGQSGWTAAEILDPAKTAPPLTAGSPFPLIHSTPGGGLSFDLGGSDQQKLQLRLAEPLMLGSAFESRRSGFAGSDVSIGGSLDWLVSDDLGVSISTSEAQTNQSAFQALGSIHCENGVLDAGSYTASGCYFVDQPGATNNLNTVSLGANYALSDHTSAAFNLFRQEARVGNSARHFAPSAATLPVARVPGVLGASLSRGLGGQPLDYLQSEVTGIDLEFQVGVSTNRAGDLRLGLQLTRILEGNAEGYYANSPGLQDWTLSQPSDSARVSFDWRKGSFSGGVDSYYRAPVEFMNRDELDSVTTFDVHFTWRTPWNANLSVGASNLLNSGVDDATPVDKALADPFESVYGRIPYVRYQQDL